MQPESKNLIWGMITGMLIGAGTALILAPMSGSETRQRIKERSAEAKEKAQTAVSKGREMMSERRAKAEEAIHRAKEAAEEKRSELQSKVKAES